MTKTVTTISIDLDIKTQAISMLKGKGVTLSFYLEQCLRNFINVENDKTERGNKLNEFI